MKLFKNIKEGIVTTILGALVGILSILVAFGVIDTQTSVGLEESLTAIIGGVVTIIALFSKDPKSFKKAAILILLFTSVAAYSQSTVIVPGSDCEMATEDAVNPVNGSVWWLRADVANYTPPPGWFIAEPNDFCKTAQLSGYPGNKCLETYQGGNGLNWSIIECNAGYDENGDIIIRQTGWSYYWVKAGETATGNNINSVRLWSNRTPSFLFQKEGYPNNSDRTLCKVRLVKSHAPLINFSNFTDKYRNMCSLATLKYLFPGEYDDAQLPEWPMVGLGLTTGLIIPNYYLDKQTHEIVNILNTNNDIKIIMVWEDNTDKNLYYRSGRVTGVLHQFESGVEYKFLSIEP